ncbi:MAG: hypothetical protein ACLQG3_14565 [Terracidiphilus sp.]
MDFPERAEIAERISRREGSLITRVRGSHVSIPVRLRRRWAMFLDWTPTPEQLRKMAAAVECVCRVAQNTLKVSVILAGIYLLLEIGAAFLPGGTVGRVITAPKQAQSCAQIGDPIAQAECVIAAEKARGGKQ